MAHTVNTPCGVWAGESERITSAGTDTVRTPSGSGGSAASCVHTTVRTCAPFKSASSSSLGLSQRNSPHLRR